MTFLNDVEFFENFEDEGEKEFKIFQFSCGIIPSVIFFIGALGNLFVILVYFRKKFQRNSLKFYFVSLSLADILTLLSSLEILFENQLNTSIRSMSEFSCKFIRYLPRIVTSTSAWILVVILFDRMVKIIFCQRFQSLNKTWVQICILLSICLLNMLVFLPEAIYSTLIEVIESPLPLKLVSSSNKTLKNTTQIANNKECRYTLRVKTVCWIHMIHSSIFPFLLMILFSSATICCILKSRQRIKAKRCRLMIQPYTIPGSSGVCSSSGGAGGGVSGSEILKKKTSFRFKSSFSKDKYFIINSIALNFVFLFLTMPLLVLNVISTQYKKTNLNSIIVLLAIYFYYVNFASLFFINMISNSIFRSEFLLMMKLKKNRVDMRM
jgi:hypothetical protein